MAIDLTKLLSTGEAQQQLQNSYSDYLKQKRELQGVRDTAEQRFTGSFGPQGETGAIVNPADIFSSFRTFQSAVPSQAESLTTESSILDQIAKLAQAQQPEPPKEPTYAERLAARKEGLDIINGEFVPIDKSEKAPELISQINELSTAAERNGARAVKDIMDVVDSAIIKFNEGNGTKTGPLSALIAQGSKLIAPNQTAQLQKDLKEILRIVRKESTGVAFSPQEIKELENEIPTILQQEGNVGDSLTRLKQRMLQKLTNYGLDTSGVVDKTTSNPQAGPMPTVSGYVIEEIK